MFNFFFCSVCSLATFVLIFSFYSYSCWLSRRQIIWHNARDVCACALSPTHMAAVSIELNFSFLCRHCARVSRTPLPIPHMSRSVSRFVCLVTPVQYWQFCTTYSSDCADRSLSRHFKLAFLANNSRIFFMH